MQKKLYSMLTFAKFIFRKETLKDKFCSFPSSMIFTPLFDPLSAFSQGILRYSIHWSTRFFEETHNQEVVSSNPRFYLEIFHINLLRKNKQNMAGDNLKKRLNVKVPVKTNEEVAWSLTSYVFLESHFEILILLHAKIEFNFLFLSLLIFLSLLAEIFKKDLFKLSIVSEHRRAEHLREMSHRPKAESSLAFWKGW